MLGRRWLSLLFLALVAVVWPSRASAWTTTNAQTRVGVFEVAAHAVVGAAHARSPENHRAKSFAGRALASDNALAAEAMPSVATPYGAAVQATSDAALAARAGVSDGATLWRIGTMGKSAAGEAQFWSLEHPLSEGFAGRYGIPPENVANADFIESATLRPGTPFVTRVAPGFGPNPGGGIEVVVPGGGVTMGGFSGL